MLKWCDTIVVEGSYFDCVQYIHIHHTYSFFAALKNEGYQFFKNGELVDPDPIKENNYG